MQSNILKFVTIIMILFFNSCQNDKSIDLFKLQANIKNASNQKVVLEEIGLIDEFRIVDSTTIDKDGKFTLKGPMSPDNESLYRIRIGGKSIFLVADSKDIEINGDLNTFPLYNAKGSKGTTTLLQLTNFISQSNSSLAALQLAIDSLVKNNASDSVVNDAEQRFNSAIRDLNQKVQHFGDTTTSLSVAIFASSKVIYDNTSDENTKNKYVAGLEKRFGDKKYIRDLKTLLQTSPETANVPKVNVGSMAPNFTLFSIDNKKISLADYKGKYVLVDFWASWCPPCRAENPNIVVAYRKYKAKNFDILGVSLDDNKTKWEKAIMDDHLTWTHVSDLKGWKSAVVDLYNIESIPSNYLLDPTGKVIAINLRGKDLERVLEEELNKVPTIDTLPKVDSLIKK